ncbi:hypothetical protein ABZ735_36320, partial [Streptomyces longwoodensis]
IKDRLDHVVDGVLDSGECARGPSAAGAPARIRAGLRRWCGRARPLGPGAQKSSAPLRSSGVQ